MLTFGSLFAGIGGFDLGFERARMVCKWQVEIDDRCREVLAHHWPDIDRSVIDVTKAGKRNLEPVDVICGGFPCQDLSVAGRREGLAGERSGLWWEFLRVIEELEPKWAVIENVPGLLSSNGGRDMATLVGSLAECGYRWAYRVVDAQYFGVAQRRRRVFIVAGLGDRRPEEILFERQSSPWDSAPSRETGQEIASDAISSIGIDSEYNADVEKIGAIRSHQSGGSELFVGTFQETGRGWWKESGTGGTLRERDSRDGASNAVVTATLNSGGNDGEFRTEPGEHLVTAFDTTQITSPGNYSQPKPGAPCHPLAETAHPPAIAFTERTRDQGRTLETQDELAYALTNPGSGGRAHSRNIAGQFGVRRLTPTECERLQGFPDGWTAVNGMKDSPRYRMLGNAVAVPCAEWLGHRIVEVENA